MFRRLLTLLTGLLVYAFQTLAQAYEPGLLVRSNGDTLRGEIENNSWIEPPTFMRFRLNPTSPNELFKPRELRAVNLTGGRLFRYEALPIDHAAEIRLDFLPKGFHPNVQVDTLLAEVLLESPGSLLRVAKFGATHYLLRRPGQPILELCERRYLRQDPSGNWLVTEGNNYQAQLAVYFGDCPAAGSAAQAAPFTAEGMIAVMQAYNTACGPTHQPARSWLQPAPKRQVAFQVGLVAGARYNHFSVSSGTNCTDCKVHPFAGLYAEFLQPSRTLSIYGEVTASQFLGQGSTLAEVIKTTYIINGISTDIYTNVYAPFAYRAWLATVRLGLRLYLPIPHEQFLFVSAGYVLDKSFNYTQLSGPPASSNIDQSSFGITFIPHIGLGWRHQRISLQLDEQYFGDGNYILRLGLGYQLARNANKVRAANN